MADNATVIKSVHTSTSGTTLVTGASYLKSINCLGATTSGTMRFYDGTSTSGTLILEIDVPGNSNNINTVTIPGPGLLFNTALYVTFPTGYNVTVFYGL
jgi:hypothetical protein